MNKYLSNHNVILAAAARGVSWTQILAWSEAYTIPLLIDALDVIGGSFNNLTVAQITAWVEAALAAMDANQPLPPLPTPTERTAMPACPPCCKTFTEALYEQLNVMPHWTHPNHELLSMMCRKSNTIEMNGAVAAEQWVRAKIGLTPDEEYDWGCLGTDTCKLTAGKFDWAAIIAMLVKILPLILPLFGS